MSDDPFNLVRPEPPVSWRDRLSALAESLDLTVRRLVVGVLVVTLGGVVAWRVLAPPSPPSEMELPLAEQAASPGEAAGSDGASDPAGASAAAGGGDGPGGTAGGAATVTTAAGGPGEPAAEVVVHVAGAVAAPGVQRLPGGARLVDAVDAAGGAVAEADLGRVNLAAPAEDGQQVYVPRVGEPAPAPATGGSDPSGGGAGGEDDAPVVDVNTASMDELETLPGVGPVTAEAIIDHRDQRGPFTAVDQLVDVRGIGDATLEHLRDRVTV